MTESNRIIYLNFIFKMYELQCYRFLISQIEVDMSRAKSKGQEKEDQNSACVS